MDPHHKSSGRAPKDFVGNVTGDLTAVELIVNSEIAATPRIESEVAALGNVRAIRRNCGSWTLAAQPRHGIQKKQKTQKNAPHRFKKKKN